MLHRRPVEADDLLRIKLVSAPSVAPSGRTVAYTVTVLDGEQNREFAAIWLLDLESGESRKFTAGVDRDSAPEWSPDSSWLAFTSNRSGTNQLWAVRVDGGEPVRLTDLPSGVSDHSWSPDGHFLLFTSRVGPEPPDENEPRRITTVRYRYDGTGYLNDQYRQIFILPFDPDAPAGNPCQLTSGNFECQQPVWSPSGHEIAFRSARYDGWELDILSDIWTVRLDGSGPRKITTVPNAWSSPIWSRDGSELFILGPSDISRAGFANVEIWSVPSAGGEPVSLTTSFDRSIGDHIIGDVPRIQADRVIAGEHAGTVHFLASDYGNTHIFRLEHGQLVQPVVTDGRRIGSFDILPDGGYVFSASTPTDPGDIFVCDADGGNERRLTDVNREWRVNTELPEPEELWVKSADGTPIQGWLLRPPGVERDQLLPLVVQLHGGPLIQYGNGFMHEFQLLASHGYSVLYGNPRGSTGYGESFAGELIGKWGEADQPDVMALIDEAIARGGVDPARIGVMGGSYGGILTNWLLGHSDRFKTAITMRSCCNYISMYGTDDISYNSNVYSFGVDIFDDPELYWRLSPIEYVNQIDAPLLIMHSEHDYRCPMEQAEQLFTALKRLGKSVEFVRFPNEGHELSRSGSPKHRIERLNWITQWFGRWL